MRPKNPPIDISALRQALKYDAETGAFTWVKVPKHAHSVKAGDRAGTVHHTGYRCVRFEGREHAEHRLAWLYHYGEWPKTLHLDHINGDVADNRIANLREATPSENGGNQRLQVNNTSGYRGVYYIKRKKRWLAQAMCDGVFHRFGFYGSAQEAAAAAEAGRRRLFGEFAREAA